MDFRTFIDLKPTLLHQYPAALDLSETNIVAAFKHMRPDPAPGSLPEKAHRCHLAEFWLDAFRLPQEWRTRALVNQGVRHALSLMFREYARQGMTACIPLDVYPVYRELANDAGLQPSGYLALAGISMAALGSATVLLLTNPLKPWGRWLQEAELSAIQAWLASDQRLRVVIDAVYDWNFSLHPSTLSLFAGGQAIVLHSLSKTWLRPLVLGIALIPQQDAELWTPIFRAESPTQENLRLAHRLLTAHASFPASLPALLADAEARLRRLLVKHRLCLEDAGDVGARYHFVVQQHWRDLLDHHAILALPASVFCDADFESVKDVSIVTSLPQTLR